MAIETELKLAIQQEDIVRVHQLSILQEFAKQAPMARRLLSTYYDTPDFAIRAKKMGLRVRQEEGQFIQTLKCSGALQNGVHQRRELECLLPTATLNIALIPDEKLSQALAPLEPLLSPIFCTDFMRTSWFLELEQGVRVEFALDVGEVRTLNKQDNFQEIELELHSGDVSILHELAHRIQEEIPAYVQSLSKAGRGYGLLR